MLKRLLLATAAMATLAGTTTVLNHPTNVASAKVVHHKHHAKKHVTKKQHAKKRHVGKYGNLGLVTIPKAMRGTWYYYYNGKYEKLRYTAHTKYEYNPTRKMVFHKRQASWQIPSKDLFNQKKVNHYYNATANWVSADWVKLSGHKWLHNSWGWIDGGGAAEAQLTKVVKIKGHKHTVLLLGSGNEMGIQFIAFHSKKMAKKYAHKKLVKHFKYARSQYAGIPYDSNY